MGGFGLILKVGGRKRALRQSVEAPVQILKTSINPEVKTLERRKRALLRWTGARLSRTFLAWKHVTERARDLHRGTRLKAPLSGLITSSGRALPGRLRHTQTSCASEASLRRTGVPSTCGPMSPYSGRDCVMIFRSSYTFLAWKHVAERAHDLHRGTRSNAP